MLKIKQRKNFSFSNLANNSSRLVEETMKEVGFATVQSLQSTINNKGFAKYDPITGIRKRQRESGVGFPDFVRGSKYRTNSDIPLRQTGNLYDSMEYVKNTGIEMEGYGLIHNDGLFDPQYKKKPMPKRPFIDIGLERTDLDEVEKIFQEKVDNYLRK